MSSSSSSLVGSPPPPPPSSSSAACHSEPPANPPPPPPPPPPPIPNPLNNGLYPPDSHHGTSMLSCLLPNLPTLTPLTSSHDVFRHSEILRANIAYHDSRQHARHYQRTDVT
uniref:Uncharacterized protein n=1 Tax=Bracon brevicornis TaxID=1563983 RepID=A0A6V7KLT6_9HYME